MGVISHGKVTAIKGVKLGTNLSHTNHALEFTSSNSKLLLAITVLSQCRFTVAQAQLSPVLSL